MPGQGHRRVPINHSRVLYRERNTVEQFTFGLKRCRHIATRYQKTATSYLGFVLFAAAHHWLRNPFAYVHRH